MKQPKLDGRDLFRNLKKQQADIKMIMMTGYPYTERDQDLMRQGVATWLLKPFESNRTPCLKAGALSLTLCRCYWHSRDVWQSYGCPAGNITRRDVISQTRKSA